MKVFFKAIVAALLIGAMGLAGAAEKGSPEEAVALVKKAIAYYKTNSRDKIIAEINNHNPQFHDKDLYLFISPLAGGPLLAHGVNPKLIGKNLDEMKDVDGVYFARKFRDVAASKEGKGWVDYKWPNAQSGQMEAKSSYVERVDDMYFACGIYKTK